MESRKKPIAVIAGWSKTDLATAGLTALVVAIGFFILFAQLREGERRAIERNVNKQADSVNARIIESVTDQIQSLNRMAAHWSSHQAADESDWKQYANAYLHQYPYYRSIAWVDQDLKVRWQVTQDEVYDVEGAPLSVSDESRGEIQAALSLGQFRITKPFWLPSGEPGISFHFPMKPEREQIQLLTATLSIKQTLEAITGPPESQEYWLAAYSGNNLLYTSAESGNSAITNWSSEFLVNMDGDEGGIRIVVNLTPAAVDELTSGMPYIVLGFGLGIAFAIGAITLLGLRSRRQAAIVNRSNRELQTEILERELAERELQHLATHDPLTGLPNRTGFHRQLDQILQGLGGGESHLCLLFVDLDRFKDINDSLGHDTGDLLLQAVPDRLRGVFEERDLMGRYGGDEFIIAVVGRESREQIDELATQVLGSFDQGFAVDGNRLYVSASIGIAFCPARGSDAAALIRNADSALNKAKKAGRNRFAVFSEEIIAEATERMAIGRDIRLGLDRDEFRVVYQPIVRLNDFSVAGVEALLRWRRGGSEDVSPEHFIPIAEESGNILRLGRFVITQTLRNMNQLRNKLDLDFWVSINVSALQFRDASFPEFLSVQMHRNRMAPNNIHLEITEKVLIENIRENREVMSDLHELGLRISVDDFGIGYSSLAYLKHFPVHCLKIDQSFVRDLPTDQDDRAIARTICALAKNLGIETISEGVEQMTQVELLKEFGCGQAQGFLFSKPLELQELVQLLQRQRVIEPNQSWSNVASIVPLKSPKP